jgi:hypothetical protein
VNITDNEPLTQRECYAWLAATFNRALPPEIVTPLERKRGTSNKRVANQKLRTLGWVPQFPSFQVGMQESVLPAYPEMGA